MKKIAISTLVLGMTLYGGMFEHSTDVKSDYWFDSKTQQENEKLANELLKFQNGTATEAEIASYLEAIKEDNETRAFEDGIYVDAAILKERAPLIAELEVEKSSASMFSWVLDLFGGDDEEIVSETNTTIQSEEDVQKANQAEAEEGVTNEEGEETQALENPTEGVEQ